MKNKRNNKGFTLIELMVVISIIGLLSSIVLASLNDAREKAQKSLLAQNFKQLQLAIETYKSNTGHYPYEGETDPNNMAGGLNITRFGGSWSMWPFVDTLTPGFSTGLTDRGEEPLVPGYLNQIPEPLILEQTLLSMIAYFPSEFLSDSGSACETVELNGYALVYTDYLGGDAFQPNYLPLPNHSFERGFYYYCATGNQ